MTRALSAAMLTEIQKPEVRMAHLLKINTAPEILLTTHYRDIVYNADTYLANGDLLQVPSIQEDLKIKSNVVSFTLTANNQSYLAQFLGTNPTNTFTSLFIAFVDTQSVVVADPIEIFSGYVDDWECQENTENKESTINLNAASVWVDFERVAGRKTNIESQRVFFPGDQGFAFASEIVKDLKWGRV